jgi:hypothetical protein
MSNYEIEGVEYPSVTTVLGLLGKGDALCYWSAKCAVDYIKDHLVEATESGDIHRVHEVMENAVKAFKTVSADACSIGSEVHHAIESWVKDKKDYTGHNEAVQNSLIGFHDWEQKNHVEWMINEITVHDKHHSYAGTADAVAMINGVKYLVDFKTSKAIYDEYRLQLAAYKYALPFEVEAVAVLRIDKETGEFDFKDLSKDIDLKYQAFLDLLSFYYKSAKRRLKNNQRAKDQK